MTMSDVVLRPAWRNYWAGFLLVLIFLLAAVGSLAGGVAESGFPGGNHLVAIVCLAVAVLVFAVMLFKRYSWKFTIDAGRISRHYGIIARNQQSVRIKDLRSIELDQSLFQRIFGVGDLAFYSAGSDDAEVRFSGITRPSAWRDRIYEAMDQEKSSVD